ncbi:MAG: anthranilate synthase component I [Deltaproteobacteria bacterium]|nr:MAG: anthranilate synthase component I [Deltaproteobacteria bacterium]
MPEGLDAFRRLAASHDLIPVSRAVFSDLETPVAAFWKLRRGAWSFLLESVEGGENWARYTMMGTEPRAIYRARGDRLTIERPGQAPEHVATTDPLGLVASRFVGSRPYVDAALPRFVGGLVGALTHDAVRWIERLPDRHADPADETPELVFLETRLVLVWDNLKHRAVLVYLAHVTGPEDADAAWAEAHAALDAAEERLAGPLPPLPTSPSPDPVPVTASMDDAAYGAVVEEARRFIVAGDIIQVVLSRRFDQPAADLHPFLVYRSLRGVNPSPYMFYLELGGTTLVGASPEVLVRQTDSLVEVRPIAGTRPRGATPEEDAALADELLADPKERAEHVMLVDLGRNDVGRVAKIGTVAVPEQMVIERYSHVMHLVSHVTGQLRGGLGPADVIRAAFPAGTLSGAPKIRAMEIIDALEESRRGFYGGAVGTIGVDGGLDLCIAIRTLVAAGDVFSVQAGAGLVYDSDPQREADETRNKARAVLRAIDQARHLFYRRSL